jgi:hypothetical protein
MLWLTSATQKDNPISTRDVPKPSDIKTAKVQVQPVNRTGNEPATKLTSGGFEAKLPAADAPRKAEPVDTAKAPEIHEHGHTDEILARAARRIENGDIAGARELLAGAELQASGQAAFALAETYDPNMLTAWGTRGAVADAAKARALYAKALNLGVGKAMARLEGLRSATPSALTTMPEVVRKDATRPSETDPAQRAAELTSSEQGGRRPTSGAGSLPGVLLGPNNVVPECATPTRMMDYLKARNPVLDPRYASVAAEYKRIGETLGLRWDYAFYQMMIETLTYRNGSRSGDVKPAQNNFAGLGATGGGESGESFKDIATGVRAHLEHLLLYAGRPVTGPVAERTHKLQEWGVLASWQAGFTRPITFSDVAAKWAAGSGAYGRILEALAEKFNEQCK